MQTRSLVATQSCRNEIAVSEVVVNLSEEREQCPFLLAATIGLSASTRTQLHVVGIFESIVLASSSEVFESIFDGFRTEESSEMVISLDVEHIVGSVRPSHRIAFAIATAHSAVVRCIAFANIASERLVQELKMLHTHIALQCQTLDRENLQVGITEDAPRSIRVVAHVVERLNWVVDV